MILILKTHFFFNVCYLMADNDQTYLRHVCVLYNIKSFICVSFLYVFKVIMKETMDNLHLEINKKYQTVNSVCISQHNCISHWVYKLNVMKLHIYPFHSERALWLAVKCDRFCCILCLVTPAVDRLIHPIPLKGHYLRKLTFVVVTEVDIIEYTHV